MIEKTKGGIILSAYVQPKASKTEFVGMHGDALKFRVAAPPVEGEANTELCRHLAKLFSLPRLGVSISSGQASRNKRIQLIGVTEDELRTTFKLPKV